MKVKVLRDATLTVTAGQTVDIREEEAAAAVALGFVVPEVEEKKPKKKK